MPVTTTVDVVNRRAVATFSGVFTAPEVNEARRMLLMEGVGAGYTILADFRAVEVFATSGSEIRTIAAQREGLPWVHPSTRFAIVAPAGNAWNVARLLEHARFPSRDAWLVCTTLEEAESYLHPVASWPLLERPSSASVLVISQNVGLAEQFIRRMARRGLTGVRVDDMATAERVMQAIAVRAIVWAELPSGSELAVKALAEKARVDAFELWPHELDSQIDMLLL